MPTRNRDADWDADLTAWNLTRAQEARYLSRISQYHARRAEQLAALSAHYGRRVYQCAAVSIVLALVAIAIVVIA